MDAAIAGAYTAGPVADVADMLTLTQKDLGGRGMTTAEIEAVEAGAADCPAVAAACGIAVRRARRVVARLVEAGHLLAVAPSRAGRPRGATLRSLSLPAAVAAARLAARNFRERYDHTFAGLRPDET